MVRQDWGKWNLDIVFPMVYHNFYTGDISFISDCTLENVRDKNPMTTLYCGMTATNGPLMFKSMDAALNNGAKGIAIFTVGGLRSPDVRKQFRSYADSARATRAALKGKPEVAVTATAHPDPFRNKGIMEAVNFRMLAFLSFAKASVLPEVSKAGREEAERFARNLMQVNTSKDYSARLNAPLRRSQELQPVLKAVSDQFMKDKDQMVINPGEYSLVKEFGTTKYYQGKELNSRVVFNSYFYFNGFIIAGWSVEP